MADTNQEIKILKQQIVKLQNDLSKLGIEYQKHQHSPEDGTRTLRKNIELDEGQYINIGLATHASQPISNRGASNEQITYSFGVGKDDGRRGLVNKADNLQMNFFHQPNNTLRQSFITAVRTPNVQAYPTTSVSIAAANNTVTIAGFNFTTNELAGGLINIYNSSGALQVTKEITSNTDTEITVIDNWGITINGGTFNIYAPVFMGSADYIYQRFYAQEGVTGGIRFGAGVTNGGQNGLLYMDDAGDLYWRDKNGDALKINNPVV
jgi:hypothetical protein